MKEYNIQIKGIKLTIRQNDDGQFEVPNFIKELQKVGTALKPSYEPVIVARKPCEGSCTDNVLKWGVGGINIDECRVGHEEHTWKGMSSKKPDGAGVFRDDNWVPKDIETTAFGRFPANTILTYDKTDYDEVCGNMPNSKSSQGIGVYRQDRSGDTVFNKQSCGLHNKNYDANKIEGYNDEGSASRYFYCAKASKRDRDEGLQGFETKQCVGVLKVKPHPSLLS